MINSLLFAAALLLATLTAPVARTDQHHVSASGCYPPVELVTHSDVQS